MTNNKERVPRGTPLPDADRERLAGFVKDHGEYVALATLGLSKETLARCLAGLTVQNGTIALVTQRLALRGR